MARRRAVRPWVACVLALACSACDPSGIRFEWSPNDSEEDATASLRKASREESLPLAVGAGRTVRVRNGAGPVRVEVSAERAPSVAVRLTAYGGTVAEARERLASFAVAVVETPEELLAEVTGDASFARRGGRGHAVRHEAALDVTVPPGVFVAVETAVGDVSLSGPAAGCDLRASVGSVSAEGVSGDVSLQASVGDVRLARISDGGAVRAASLRGDVSLRNVSASRVEAETRSGRIDASDLAALETVLRADAGEARVRGGQGAIRVETVSGDIRVSDVAGSVQARAVRGDVTLENVGGGALSARTAAGNVRASVRAGPGGLSSTDLSAVDGDVTLDLPEDVGCALSAQTSAGTVDSAYPLAREGASGAGASFSGTAGAGGPGVSLRTERGDIRIRKR